MSDRNTGYVGIDSTCFTDHVGIRDIEPNAQRLQLVGRRGRPVGAMSGGMPATLPPMPVDPSGLRQAASAGH